MKKRKATLRNETIAVVRQVDISHPCVWQRGKHAITIVAEDGNEYVIPGMGLCINPLDRIKITIAHA